MKQAQAPTEVRVKVERTSDGKGIRTRVQSRFETGWREVYTEWGETKAKASDLMEHLIVKEALESDRQVVGVQVDGIDRLADHPEIPVDTADEAMVLLSYQD